MGLGDLGRRTRNAGTRGLGDVGLGDVGLRDVGLGVIRLRDVELGDVGLRDVGRGDSGTRGLGDAWRLGNVMNKPYFWAEFVKYDYKDREENTVTYQESPP